MERRGPFVLAGILLLVGVSVGTLQGPTLSSVAPAKNRAAGFASSAQKTQALANYSRLPLSLEPKQGQAGSPVQYMARGGQFNVFLTQDEVAFGFARRHSRRRSVLDMEESAAVEPPELSGPELRLVGANPSGQWHANQPTFAKVCYGTVYPGIDLLYYGNQLPMACLKRPRELGRVQ